MIRQNIQPTNMKMRTQWTNRLNEAHISPAYVEVPLCLNVALPLVASWTLLAVLLRTRRFRPVVERFLPSHNPYSMQSYTLLTSAIRFVPSACSPSIVHPNHVW